MDPLPGVVDGELAIEVARQRQRHAEVAVP